MVLIYTALQSEAQSFIEYFKLQKIHNTPKIYANEDILVAIGGIGEDNTIKSLHYIFDNFKITKAFNIGICGINHSKVPIGSLFCTNKNLQNIDFLSLITVKTPKTTTDNTNTTLYDMEANFFHKICLEYLQNKDIFIFKVVSDYLDDTIPSKEFIKQLIKQHIKSIIQWI